MLDITAIEVDYCAHEGTFQANNCLFIECYCLCLNRS